MEGEGLANIAAAIATGPEVAQGGDFEPVRLETRRASRSQSKPSSNVFQPDFAIRVEDKCPEREKRLKASLKKL